MREKLQILFALLCQQIPFDLLRKIGIFYGRAGTSERYARSVVLLLTGQEQCTLTG